MGKGGDIFFTGERFKSLLNLKGLTYKEVAAELNLDKNTIGKVVRGGNINVKILLTLCNGLNFSIFNFFKEVAPDGTSYFVEDYLHDLPQPQREEPAPRRYYNNLNDLPIEQPMNVAAERKALYGMAEREYEDLKNVLDAKDQKIRELEDRIVAIASQLDVFQQLLRESYNRRD